MLFFCWGEADEGDGDVDLIGGAECHDGSKVGSEEEEEEFDHLERFTVKTFFEMGEVDDGIEEEEESKAHEVADKEAEDGSVEGAEVVSADEVIESNEEAGEEDSPDDSFNNGGEKSGRGVGNEEDCDKNY